MEKVRGRRLCCQSSSVTAKSMMLMATAQGCPLTALVIFGAIDGCQVDAGHIQKTYS